MTLITQKNVQIRKKRRHLGLKNQEWIWVKSILVWVFCLLWFTPVIWMFITSLKDSQLAAAEKIPRWIPETISFENYKLLFAPASGISVLKGIQNSILVAVLSIAATLVICVPAAYALSRLEFRGKKFVLWAYIAILAFPGILFLVPNYFIVHALGMMDSFSALIVPGLGGTFGVFMLRQYMLGISRDLEDAAWIDGCSRFRFMISIVVPFVRPALIVLSLMTFIGSWNSFLWPLLVLNSPDKLTLPIALVRFTAGWGDPFRGIGVLMAGAFVSTLPTLILFIAFYRYLMDGVSMGAVGK
jgi:multiple sugar transport system permease protein